jgi:formylglycine-generating enzyme required for sulfatase activity/uncharacterized caspase-like protein
MEPKAMRIILKTLLGLGLILPIWPSSASEGQSRNQARGLKLVKNLPDKSKRFAVVIGVDQYRDKQINRLYGAAKDAQTLKEALVKYAGFPEDQVTLLATGEPEEREPSRANILQRLLNLNGLVPQDGLLLVSFAGHGMQRGETAFLLPSDAKIGSLSLLENTAISVADMKRYIRQTGAKQVVVILDACRNDPGGRADAPNPMTEAYRFDFDTRNQQVEAFATLYATGEGQRAYEYTEKNQGYFTWALIEGLKGEAANERGEVTLSGLVGYLQEKVPKRVLSDLGQEKKQRPWAQVEGYKADELVISITPRVPPPTPAVSALDPAAIELEFWNSIKNSTDSEDFKEYLSKYPNGTFAGLARNKIRTLEAAANSSAVQPKTESRPTATAAKPVSSGGTSTAGAGLGGLPLRGFEFDVVTVNSSGAETSRRKGQAQYCTEDVAGISLELVLVPGGKFVMGSTEWEGEEPPHQVTVGSFYMGKYEVTQAQWRAVASLPKVARDLNPDPSYFKGDNLPVEQVSWDDAVEFCARLSRATGRSYRLPTEAEWEYACRAGTTTAFAFGQTITPQVVNYDGDYPYAQAPKGTFRETTTPVGFMGVANAFGLYDMHGNVWEWCMDYWHESYKGAPTDGSSWERGGDASDRVLRGGSWSSNASYCRSANRDRLTPDYRFNAFGFRVVAVGRTR